MSHRAWVYAGIGLAVGGVTVGLVNFLSGPKILPGRSRLLLVGDSLAVGLAPPLRALSADARVTFDSIAKEGTRIDQWARSQVLADKLAQFQPTLILVSLGTNDEYLPSAAPQEPHLHELLERLRKAAPVAWIGPPTLPKSASNGVTPMIKANVPRSHYFPSDSLQIPRGPDGIHPTARGYAGWAGALWRWIS